MIILYNISKSDEDKKKDINENNIVVLKQNEIGMEEESFANLPLR